MYKKGVKFVLLNLLLRVDLGSMNLARFGLYLVFWPFLHSLGNIPIVPKNISL